MNSTISKQEFFNDSYACDIYFIQSNYNSKIKKWARAGYFRSNIRNFVKIILDPDYIKLDIIEIKYLDSGECTACIKTFWLKILQRKWKKKFDKRKKIIAFYKNPKNIDFQPF